MTEHTGETPWSGRFEETPSARTQAFGASLPVDKRMWREDIEGSRAHAHGLVDAGVISSDDFKAINEGFDQITQMIEAGTFEWNIEDEDVHMALEKKLTELIGTPGARLHTGRSRNDQVACDTRLYIKHRLVDVLSALQTLRHTILERAAQETETVMPGYTHMQKAQPILLAHYLLAYVEMLTRDFARFMHAYEATDVSVLGCAALAGTTYPLDRTKTAGYLGFSTVNENSLDGVSDRDFLLDAAYAASVCQMHLSRLSEELILWSTGEFGFVTLSDAYSTGSSIMPQKKNPDFAELVRGKTGRVYGDLMQLLTMLKGIPLTYDKDMQEDKEGVFDALDTLEASLELMAGMMGTLVFNRENMAQAALGGFMAATDVADYLVGKGMPFRQAHEVVGSLVLFAEKLGKTLQELSLEEYTSMNELFGADVFDAISPQAIVSKRMTIGGTGHKRVAEQLQGAQLRFESDTALLHTLQ